MNADALRDALDGLDRARKGIAAWVATVIALTVGCCFVSERALSRLAGLLGRRLVAYDASEPLLALLTLSLFGGLFLSLPAGVWLLWTGVSARFFPRWRRWGGLVVLAATALFAAGATLCWRVLLPAGIGFLVGFEEEGTRALISAGAFISFVGTMLLAMGLSFEAPLIAFFLARAGWLTPDFFRKRWRHAVLVCTALAAVITPTPDIYNMTLMAFPLLGLYFASFVVTLLSSGSPPPREGRKEP